MPTIGIGAGPATAGQVLVFHDLLGITEGHLPKFVKRYAETTADDGRGRRATTSSEVRAGAFPGPEHVYAVEPARASELTRYLDQESLSSSASWDWEPLP